MSEPAPREPYFLGLQAALKEAGIATPTLVIDRDRLDANIDTVRGQLPEGMGLRLVAKSLPSPHLLNHIRQRAGTDRLMTFNLPMLIALARATPEADQLLGKPLPIAAARAFFKAFGPQAGEAAWRVRWLIDTPERLIQYADLADEISADLDIVLELDVGLHRGGFHPGEALGAVLETLRTSNRLRFAGFMGYEVHVAFLPDDAWRERALEGAWRTYRAGLEQAEAVFGADALDGRIRNAGGSPTYRLYQDMSVANEVSLGSCLVKPSSFDLEPLAPLAPASFIAAPVLKVSEGIEVPAGEFAEPPLDARPGTMVYTYGGNWMADAVDPPGLSTSRLAGRSSNQERLEGPPDLAIAPDDFVFLRPRQSEAVFLQFGDIAVYAGGKIVGHWPAFPAAA